MRVSTVAEVIEALQRLPPHAEVFVEITPLILETVCGITLEKIYKDAEGTGGKKIAIIAVNRSRARDCPHAQ